MGTATRRTRPSEPSAPGTRLTRLARRDLLIDAVVAIIEARGLEAVSMEAVAERAGVSRPLVYRHFANRGELLAATYRREAEALHAELAREVAAAGSLVEMYRALVRGSLRATNAPRSGVFAALRAGGAFNRELRRDQRDRDVGTVRAFSARAVKELGLERRQATAATVLLLGALDPLVAQWRLRPTADNAELLETTYLAMVDGAYRRRAGDRATRRIGTH
ncbi:MAG: TetR/AcrR family transcriptional regulator [Acidimicrobiales bacterium]